MTKRKRTLPVRAPLRQKMRISADADVGSVLLDKLTCQESIISLRSEYATNQPYEHVSFDPIGDPIKMRLIVEELKSLKATYKETDLFKLYQTIDLANLTSRDPIAKNLKELLSLRDSIYSKKFRKFISEVTGCGELTDRVDCAANAYVKGSHLLCHDDVIGNRCISYIIYLTDPDDPWLHEDGGLLELYPLDCTENKKQECARGIPATIPTGFIIPKFNAMAIFKVEPGRSYHAVQEVFVDDKPRLSIQGWYHAPLPPVGSDMASLKQVMKKGELVSSFSALSAQRLEDRFGGLHGKSYLSEYVNPMYLTADSICRINKHFCKNSSIQLHNFIRDDLCTGLIDLMNIMDEHDQLGVGRRPSSYSVGVGDGWVDFGPPHIRRHLNYQHTAATCSGPAPAASLGRLLFKIYDELFRSPYFAEYLCELTTLRPVKERTELRRFRPGLDYTVAYYGGMCSESRLDATLCFVNCAGEEERELWSCGEVGGFECYMSADVASGGEDEPRAAEVYRADPDAEDELLSVTPFNNVLNLVMRDPGTMRFVKYLSTSAPGSRWDVSVEYELDES